MNVRVDGPAIVVDRLGKTYRAEGPPALQDLSLTVEAGEVYGLLGVNGSGKSTLVGVLATLLMPTTGSARVLGHDVVADAPAVRRRIGVTLQEAGVDPAATGRALLRLHGQLLGLSRPEREERSRDLLATVDLTEAADRPLRTYSGGMRRRLDLALALVGDPGVLFLDEPTTGLDPLSRQALWAEVRRLRERGTTILLTTQYLEEADALADRVGILDGGRLRIQGAPEQLKRQLGTDVLRLHVDPSQAELAATVLDIPVPSEADGPGQLVVPVSDGSAALPRVLATLTDRGVAVREASLSRPTLDDVFTRVVGERLVPATSQPTGAASPGASSAA